jgi:hypothetical protein
MGAGVNNGISSASWSNSWNDKLSIVKSFWCDIIGFKSFWH